MSDLTAETVSPNGTDVVSWRHCDVHTRSTFNILSLCISTLVICVWNAVHPDIPRRTTPRWKVYLTRFCGLLIGLFLPELLVLNAIDQWIIARILLSRMNERDNDSPNLKFPFLKVAWWKELGQSDMLPFLRFGWWKEVNNLTVEHKDQLLSLTEESIQDHSKAGALAKLLFCWQLLVFIINCVGRRMQHLPLSLLEITTLAHALCGLATFALYWHKPHSVNNAIVIVPVNDDVAIDRDKKSNGDHKQFVKYILYPFYIVYVIASCFIIAESIRQLFALPSGAFEVPALICYLPHFS
ncbi:hypothetical protein AURDEDRAFT_171555 [Auricularia subglabra TFB-10046 SS5]|nr:hypothetical protein AURDEDRAFT_171555 [Auricularia subglabra TFB-10046 SS5]